MSKCISICLLALITISCFDDSLFKQGKYHPDLSLLYSESDTVLISVKKDRMWDEEYIFSFDDRLKINIQDEKYLISRFTDVLILGDKILVLDEGAKKVHSISHNGTVNNPVTILGRGPGELSEPTNMMMLSDSYLVADRVNGIHYFDFNNNLLKTRRFDFIPDHFCQFDSTRFFAKSSYLLLDSGEGIAKSLIFEINDNGTVLNEYIPRYNHESNMLVYNMSNGPLLCVPSKELIINSYASSIPAVELEYVGNNYSIVYNFSDIKPFLIEYSNNTLFPSEKNYGTIYHNFKAINILNNRFLIVQYREVDRPKNPDLDYDYKILSYVLDLDTSTNYYTYSIPVIISSNEGQILYRNPSNYDELFLAYYEISKF